MQTNLALGLGINTIPVEEIGGTPPLPGLILDANYAGDSYSLNGVSKTLAEIMPDLLNTIVIPGQGLAEVGPSTTSASASVLFSADVFNALPVNHEISGVIDVVASSGTGDCYGILNIDINNGNGAGAGIYGPTIKTQDASNGHNVIAENDPLGNWRIGFTFTQARFAICVFGGVVFELTPINANFGLFNNVYLYLYANSNQSTIIARTQICLPMTDAQLQAACT